AATRIYSDDSRLGSIQDIGRFRVEMHLNSQPGQTGGDFGEGLATVDTLRDFSTRINGCRPCTVTAGINVAVPWIHNDIPAVIGEHCLPRLAGTRALDQ